MADEHQLAILKQGVPAWNQWRLQNPELYPELFNADIQGANLLEANLDDADLQGANLQDTKLSQATFDSAILRGANLRGANLRGANLVAANLSGADLQEALLWGTNWHGAILSGANFRKADLTGAEFSGAILNKANLGSANLETANFRDADLAGADLSAAVVGWTLFGANDLSGVIGLETVVHRGPSTIGIDTLYKSQGKIPDAFLRGAGVPGNFIAYAHSLVETAIEFYSCFISHSSRDQTFAERLHAGLQAKGVRCWLAAEDLKIGDRFQDKIEEAIRVFDKVIIVLSAGSVASRWVEREVNAAREREDRESRTVLFPIRIDGAVMEAPQPWAADIRRTRHIGDLAPFRTI